MLLKTRSRRLLLILVATILGWYLLYAAVSAFAPGLMDRRLAGGVPLALVFGGAQFASTFIIAWRYGRYSREVFDPLAAQILADADRRANARHDGGGAR